MQPPCFFLVVHNYQLTRVQIASVCTHFLELSSKLDSPWGRGIGLISGDFNFPHDSATRWKGDSGAEFSIAAPSPNDQSAKRAWRTITDGTMLATDHAPNVPQIHQAQAHQAQRLILHFVFHFFDLLFLFVLRGRACRELMLDRVGYRSFVRGYLCCAVLHHPLLWRYIGKCMGSPLARNQ
jgi:hypothetical protein